MIILGIDPGIERLGWAVVSYHENKILKAGCIITDPKENIAKRFFFIYQELEQILQNFPVRLVGLEKVIPALHKTSLFEVAQVRGVILSLIGKYDLSFYEVTPREVKKAITNSGKSKKEDIIRVIQKFYSFAPQEKLPDDTYDAIAIAFAFPGNYDFKA